METCVFCQSNIPIHDKGVLIIQGKIEAINKIIEVGSTIDDVKVEQLNKKELVFSYQVQSQLDMLAVEIEKKLFRFKDEEVLGAVLQERKDVHIRSFVPLKQLINRIKNPDMVQIIQDQLFTSHIQPIISTVGETVYGYEFLLRPKRIDFSPGALFSFAQKSGLQSKLDSVARINAIRTSSKLLPNGTKRFINFLPSSIYNPEHCLQSTFYAVEQYNVNPDDLIFEVVETEKIEDMAHLKNIFYHYQKSGMKVALDDIGAGFSTIDVLKELKPDYAKIDRKVIMDCYKDETKMKKIKELHVTAKENGIYLLAEGIEAKEEWEFLKEYVDFGQGYFFGRPAEKPIGMQNVDGGL
ncbi:EAL domain-containing protein [Evansella sp. AB-rgal1]|uniref:EAL domain-containing protein n=1 Tax=Evansella sp. AB-rgal1 TaxID=3242696 RepID=UPI00359EF51D